MKKRIAARKKVVRSKSKAWHEKKHLHVHRIFIFTSVSIFVLSVLFAFVHTILSPIAARNETYYANTQVLGEQDTSWFTKLVDLLSP